MTDISTALVAAVHAAHARLAQDGCVSVLADEKWLSLFFPEDDIEEYKRVNRALAIEAILSQDPSAILYSDPGEYSFQTSLVHQLVSMRFDKHGPVLALVADPKRQHLVQLTAPAQRRSYFFQNKYGATRDEVFYGMAIASELRASELQQKAGQIESVLQQQISWDTGNLFLHLLSQLTHAVRSRALGDQNSRPGAFIEIGDGASLELSVSHRMDPKKSTSAASGHVNLIVHGQSIANGRPIANGRTLVFYSRALPNEFERYSFFGSPEEQILCVMAWVYASGVLFDALFAAFPGARLVVKT